MVVGRVDNPDGTSNAAGTVAFAISINDLARGYGRPVLSLKHPTSPDNYDEAVNLGGLVNAVVTVTDGDGDIATQRSASATRSSSRTTGRRRRLS